MSLTIRPPVPLRSQRAAVAAALAILVIALSMAVLWRLELATAVGKAADEGLNKVKTVAAMLADRSPGQRPEGALASLKAKRQPALHERALAKVRGPVPPENPLAKLIGPPPNAPVTTVPTVSPPLFAMLGGPPPVVVAPITTPGGGSPGGGAPGGPPGFSEIPPPGGGGGVVLPPPITTTQVPPPVTSAVPEPGTWAMMIVGFALVGWAFRRERRKIAVANGG